MHLNEWVWGGEESRYMEGPPHTPTSCTGRQGKVAEGQGSNPHLLHWQADSLPLSHQGRAGATATQAEGVGAREKRKQEDDASDPAEDSTGVGSK